MGTTLHAAATLWHSGLSQGFGVVKHFVSYKDGDLSRLTLSIAVELLIIWLVKWRSFTMAMSQLIKLQ